MTKTIQIVWFFISMVVAVGGGSFAVFKWIDKQQDTDTSITQDIELQKQQCQQDSIWKESMLQEIDVMQIKIDSSIIIGLQNQHAIHQNRSSYLRHVKSDSSLTKDELMEILEPYMEEIKKNATWTPFAGS